MALIALPIMILNFFSGIVGGIWLAALGYWHVVLVGLALIFAGAFLVSLLLMPSLILITPALSNPRIAESKIAMVPLGLLSVGYTYCVMGAWALGIFWYFGQNVKSDAIFPAILWSYSTATAVWSYMAQKEAQSGNEYSPLSAFFNQIGCIILMIYVYNHFRRLDLYEMAIWFAVPMAIALVAQIAMMSAMMQQRRY